MTVVVDVVLLALWGLAIGVACLAALGVAVVAFLLSIELVVELILLLFWRRR